MSTPARSAFHPPGTCHWHVVLVPVYSIYMPVGSVAQQCELVHVAALLKLAVDSCRQLHTVHDKNLARPAQYPGGELK